MRRRRRWEMPLRWRAAYLLAQKGMALLGCLLPIVAVLVVAALLVLPARGRPPGMVASVAVVAVLSTVLGWLVGGLGQVVLRGWLSLHPGPTEPTPPPGLGFGLWYIHYLQCARSLNRLRSDIDSVPEGPARDWLADIHGRLEQRREEVRRLAVLGDVLAPGARRPLTPQAVILDRRLRDIVFAFQGATQRGARVAESLRSAAREDDVRAELVAIERELEARGTG